MSFTLHTDSISLYYSFNNKHIEHLYFFPIKNNESQNKFILLYFTHLCYWCTSGVGHCMDSPSSYCHVKAVKNCNTRLKHTCIHLLRHLYHNQPAKHHHNHNGCHDKEKRGPTHDWAHQQRKPGLDLLWMLLCGRENETPSAIKFRCAFIGYTDHFIFSYSDICSIWKFDIDVNTEAEMFS